ncbi:MAG: hypothetical protein JKY56_20415, partial [Kofleriaceae bacterium]|nr:hypothetical protein [Kofleriaceae bacterium]
SSDSSSSDSSSSDSSSSDPDPTAQRTQSRSPTVDPELSTMTMGDEGQLSFEDATRELDLNAMEMGPSQGNTARRSEPETLKLEPEDTTKQLDLHAMDLGPSPARNKGEDDEGVPKKPDHDDVQSGRIDIGLSEDEMSDLQIGDSPTGATTNGIMAEISAEAPSSGSERTSYIVNRLIKHTVEMTDEGSYKEGASSSMYALEYADDNAVAQKLVVENERQLIRALVFGLGDLSEVPRLVIPMTEIPFDDIDHRAAFLLTRMDGTLTLEEILDVSGMPRLEALRHLTRLHTKGYLVVE